MNHQDDSVMRPDLDALLGAYALDAIEPVEQFELDAYLDANPRARAEVDDMREAAAMLALIIDERDAAPASLWNNIEAEISRHETTAVEGHAIQRPVDLGAERERRVARRSLATRVAALVAVAAAAAAITFGLTNRSKTPSLSAQYSAAAKHHEIMLASTVDHSDLARVALGSDGRGYIRNDGMHRLTNGKVYQLWVIPAQGSAPVSIGIVSDAAKYVPVAIPGKFMALAISIEDAPGAVTPSTPIASGAA